MLVFIQVMAGVLLGVFTIRQIHATVQLWVGSYSTASAHQSLNRGGSILLIIIPVPYCEITQRTPEKLSAALE